MGFGPDFAAADAVCREAWIEVAGDLSLPQRARTEWISAHRSGDPRAEVKAILGAIADADWRWQRLETWAAAFRAGGTWPHMWLREGADTAARLTTPAFRCAILAHTLAHTAFRIRDMRHNLAEAFQERGYRLSVIQGCTVEAEVAGRHAARIEAGDISTLPPFFPGDRTSLRPKRR